MPVDYEILCKLIRDHCYSCDIPVSAQLENKFPVFYDRLSKYEPQDIQHALGKVATDRQRRMNLYEIEREAAIKSGQEHEILRRDCPKCGGAFGGWIPVIQKKIPVHDNRGRFREYRYGEIEAYSGQEYDHEEWEKKVIRCPDCFPGSLFDGGKNRLMKQNERDGDGDPRHISAETKKYYWEE